MEANIGLMLPQAEEHQGATENGDQEGSFMGPSWELGLALTLTLDSGLQNNLST